MGPPLQRQLHFDQSGSLAAAWRSFWAQAIFSCPAGPATIEIDECVALWDTQLPSRILTSRSTLRYPYHKSDPSENRFGAVWLKVCATLRRETHFGQSGALAAVWCTIWTRACLGCPAAPPRTMMHFFISLSFCSSFNGLLSPTGNSAF